MSLVGNDGEEDELPFGDDVVEGGGDEKKADLDFEEDEAACSGDDGGEKELPNEAMAARASS
eukprot:CAMPEP_0201728440 /NCGR_PEP_ID=MMETSP0593-20130828/15927_1 /ASSEMBLY_ACC=CAM_ASM_000672 /TAXON_ID=267983 /ORGANISM="Skeletonema japonicum, Strain CCMP2506" /LENGTH=61 /DNA_ID=CAMNT_0048220551 /DNA_START=379 /DNA_END=564 /DNA_ORIENTATION=+